MKTAWKAALAAATITLAACSSSANDNPTIGGGAVGQISDVSMQAVNGGQSGAAKLTESPSVVLTLTIALQSASGSQPASIHSGTCTGFDAAPKFALKPVVDGQSTTSPLNTTLGELSSSPYVIVVQRSATDPTTASCGPIPVASTPPS